MAKHLSEVLNCVTDLNVNCERGARKKATRIGRLDEVRGGVEPP